MWMKNIIPNEVWTDEASSFGPIPLKLGYHRSVVANYDLQTTRELPKCSALGYDQSLSMILRHHDLLMPLCPYFFSIGLLFLVILFSHVP